MPETDNNVLTLDRYDLTSDQARTIIKKYLHKSWKKEKRELALILVGAGIPAYLEVETRAKTGWELAYLVVYSMRMMVSMERAREWIEKEVMAWPGKGPDDG